MLRAHSRSEQSDQEFLSIFGNLQYLKTIPLELKSSDLTPGLY
jgi:hypothetical protein